MVELLRQNDKDWFHGRCDQREGMFPVNFVDVIEPLPAHLVNVAGTMEVSFRPKSLHLIMQHFVILLPARMT